MQHKLVTAEIKKLIKKYPIMSQDEAGMDAVVIAKFFHPFSNITWYVTEGQILANDDIEFFGYVKSDFSEWGTFMLSNLEAVDVHGCPIERDAWFKNGKTTVKEAIE